MKYTQAYVDFLAKDTKTPHVIAYDKLRYKYVVIPLSLYKERLYYYDTKKTVFSK
jgi:hypothetical protein